MKPTCVVSECDRPAHCKGLCKRHYQQQWATGSPEIRRPNPHGTLEDRFLRYVIKGKKPDECWSWIGFHDKDGYGKLRTGSSNKGAHVISWELHYGTVPDGMLVRHKCNNSGCPNPLHLMLGDHDQNMRDRVEAGHYASGESHPMVKFSDEVINAIREASGTYKEISDRFGVSISQVGNIRRGVQRMGDSPAEVTA